MRQRGAVPQASLISLSACHHRSPLPPHARRLATVTFSRESLALSGCSLEPLSTMTWLPKPLLLLQTNRRAGMQVLDEGDGVRSLEEMAEGTFCRPLPLSVPIRPTSAQPSAWRGRDSALVGRRGGGSSRKEIIRGRLQGKFQRGVRWVVGKSQQNCA